MHMTEDTVESVCRYNDFGERGTEWGGNFTHDFSGRRTYAVTDGSSTQQYECDAMGRLTTAMGDGMQYRYTYYENGRLRENRQAAEHCSLTPTTSLATSRQGAT